MKNEKYLTSLEHYEILCATCSQLSINTHKRKVSSWREEYGSYIYSKIATHSIAILKLLPESSLFELPENFKVWDISSLSVLLRALIETYNSFYYLIIDKIETEELDFRYLLWHLHSENERLKMLKFMGSVNPQIRDIEKRIEEFRGKLIKNSTYNSFPSKRRTKFRKGETGISLTNSEISKRAGISTNYFRATYKYLSSYAHTFPFSIQQIAVFKADDDDSLDLIKNQIDVAIGYLSFSIRDYVKLFPDQSDNISEAKPIMDIMLEVLNKLGA